MKSDEKSVVIALDCLIENFRRHSIKFGQVAIKHHLLSTHYVNAARDHLDGCGGPSGRKGKLL